MARDRRPRDDDDEDDTPRRKRRPADEDDDEEPRAKKRAAEDDDEEPRPRRKARARDDYDDQEEDEDVRPRRRKKKPAGMSKGLLFGLIGGGVALVAVIVLLFVFLGGSGSPKSAYNELWSNAQNKRFDRVWDGLSKRTQDEFNAAMPMLAGKTGGKTGKEGFVKLMELVPKDDDPANENHVVTKEEITGDTAILTIEVTQKSRGSKSTETHRMVKEGGRWKLDGFGN